MDELSVCLNPEFIMAQSQSSGNKELHVCVGSTTSQLPCTSVGEATQGCAVTNQGERVDGKERMWKGKVRASVLHPPRRWFTMVIIVFVVKLDVRYLNFSGRHYSINR